MIFGYEFIANNFYTAPSYQHVILSQEVNYKPLILDKTNNVKLSNVKLSLPLFKIFEKQVIYFDFDSYKVKDNQKNKLQLIKYPVILKGYASPEGSRQYNLELSRKRIESVKRLLKNVSILKEEALGEDPCSLPKNKWHLCRKVEIIQIEKSAFD